MSSCFTNDYQYQPFSLALPAAGAGVDLKSFKNSPFHFFHCFEYGYLWNPMDTYGYLWIPMAPLSILISWLNSVTLRPSGPYSLATSGGSNSWRSEGFQRKTRSTFTKRCDKKNDVKTSMDVIYGCHDMSCLSSLRRVGALGVGGSFTIFCERFFLYLGECQETPKPYAWLL